jgi:hypothetical protein
VGYIHKLDFYLLSQTYPCPQDILKRPENPWRVLFVHTKLDCPIFAGSYTRTDLTLLPLHSFFTTLSSSSTVRASPRLPLVISLFLYGILVFLGEINSPRIRVSDSPTGFSLLKVFSPPHRSLCPMDGFKIPSCIVSIHVLEHSPTISLSFLGLIDRIRNLGLSL